MRYKNYYDFRIVKEDRSETSLTEEISDFIMQSEEDSFLDLQYAFDGYDMDQYFSPDTLMPAISRQFPDTIFAVYRTGEDITDLAVTYYENGETYHGKATITYPSLAELKNGI